MADDALVEDLLASMHSFTEEALCPICNGHGAVTQGKRDFIIDMLPKPLPDGVQCSTAYTPSLKATVLNFTITGKFLGRDSGMVNQAWEDIEGQLRKEFERMLEQLHEGWQKSSALQRIQKAEEEAQRPKKIQMVHPTGPTGAAAMGAYLNPVDKQTQQRRLKEQQVALAAYLSSSSPPAPLSEYNTQVAALAAYLSSGYNTQVVEKKP